MNRRVVLLFLLATAVAAQLAVPAWMIARREAALRHGTVLRFRTAPVDPYDAFRGRYVALSIRENIAPGSIRTRAKQTVYVQACADSNGFARLTAVALHPGLTGVWFRARAEYESEPGLLRVKLPFDRFYLPEAIAPEAEALYRNANRPNASGKTGQETWLQVRVLHHLAVAEELYIHGLPIREALLREKRAD